MTEEEIEEVMSGIESPVLLSCNIQNERVYSVRLKGLNREWGIQLRFPDSFPFRLPKAYLLNKDMIGVLPHVNREGLICLEEGDSLWVNHTNPSDIIEFFLEEASKALDRFSFSAYQDELLDEYEGYFLAPNRSNSVNSFYKAGNRLELPRLMLYQQSGKKNRKDITPIILHPEGGGIPKTFSNASVSERLRANTIVHLPLEHAVLPPSNGDALSAEYIYGLRKSVSAKNIKRLEKELKKKPQHYWAFVLISMPRTDGSRTQLLLRFTAEKPLPHPLAQINSGWEIDVFRLNRLNPEYLLQRGGAGGELKDKHIAVVGCGSVGGEVAYMLAKAGCGKLTLIDDEYLEADNIYRHRLGGQYLNFKQNNSGYVDLQYKVDALAHSLMADLPYINVLPVTKQLNESNKGALPTDVDLVIVAVGSPSDNSIINQMLKDTGFNKVVFCWNEAVSVGGHAIALDLKSSCYQCLHSTQDGLAANTCLTLVEPGKAIAKNLTGCAGVFTPFSYLDSVRTAELASQLAINLISRNEHSIARSWRGMSSDKVKTTERYDSMAERETLELCRSAHCGVCNG